MRWPPRTVGARSALAAALFAFLIAKGCDRQADPLAKVLPMTGVALAEGVTPAPTPQAPTNTPSPGNAGGTGDEAAESAANTVAFSWLSSLRRHDTAALLTATKVPFVLRDTGREGHCKNVVIEATKEVLPALKCLLDDRALADVLKANRDPQGGPVPREILPNWAGKWGKDIARDVYPIAITYAGKRASFDFLVLASGTGVRGVFKHTSVEAR